MSAVSSGSLRNVPTKQTLESEIRWASQFGKYHKKLQHYRSIREQARQSYANPPSTTKRDLREKVHEKVKNLDANKRQEKLNNSVQTVIDSSILLSAVGAGTPSDGGGDNDLNIAEELSVMESTLYETLEQQQGGLVVTGPNTLNLTAGEQYVRAMMHLEEQQQMVTVFPGLSPTHKLVSYGVSAVVAHFTMKAFESNIASFLGENSVLAKFLTKEGLKCRMKLIGILAQAYESGHDPRKDKWRVCREVMAGLLQAGAEMGSTEVSMWMAGLIVGTTGPYGVCVMLVTVQIASQTATEAVVKKLLLYDDSSFVNLMAEEHMKMESEWQDFMAKRVKNPDFFQELSALPDPQEILEREERDRLKKEGTQAAWSLAAVSCYIAASARLSGRDSKTGKIEANYFDDIVQTYAMTGFITPRVINVISKVLSKIYMKYLKERLSAPSRLVPAQIRKRMEKLYQYKMIRVITAVLVQASTSAAKLYIAGVLLNVQNLKQVYAGLTVQSGYLALLNEEDVKIQMSENIPDDLQELIKKAVVKGFPMDQVEGLLEKLDQNRAEIEKFIEEKYNIPAAAAMEQLKQLKRSYGTAAEVIEDFDSVKARALMGDRVNGNPTKQQFEKWLQQENIDVKKSLQQIESQLKSMPETLQESVTGVRQEMEDKVIKPQLDRLREALQQYLKSTQDKHISDLRNQFKVLDVVNNQNIAEQIKNIGDNSMHTQSLNQGVAGAFDSNIFAQGLTQNGHINAQKLTHSPKLTASQKQMVSNFVTNFNEMKQTFTQSNSLAKLQKLTNLLTWLNAMPDSVDPSQFNFDGLDGLMNDFMKTLEDPSSLFAIPTPPLPSCFDYTGKYEIRKDQFTGAMMIIREDNGQPVSMSCFVDPPLFSVITSTTRWTTGATGTIARVILKGLTSLFGTAAFSVVGNIVTQMLMHFDQTNCTPNIKQEQNEENLSTTLNPNGPVVIQDIDNADIQMDYKLFSCALNTLVMGFASYLLPGASSSLRNKFMIKLDVRNVVQNPQLLAAMKILTQTLWELLESFVTTIYNIYEKFDWKNPYSWAEVGEHIAVESKRFADKMGSLLYDLVNQVDISILVELMVGSAGTSNLRTECHRLLKTFGESKANASLWSGIYVGHILSETLNGLLSSIKATYGTLSLIWGWFGTKEPDVPTLLEKMVQEANNRGDNRYNEFWADFQQDPNRTARLLKENKGWFAGAPTVFLPDNTVYRRMKAKYKQDVWNVLLPSKQFTEFQTNPQEKILVSDSLDTEYGNVFTFHSFA